MKFYINKIKSIIFSSKFVFIMWFFYLFYPLISVVRFNYILKYSNSSFFVIRVFFSLSQRYLLVFLVFIILVIITLWFRKFLKVRINKNNLLVFLTILITSLIDNIFISLLLSLEKKYYANFLYSHYGLVPVQLEFISTVNVLIISLSVSFIFFKAIQLSSRGNLIRRTRNLGHEKIIQLQKLVFLLGLVLLTIFTFQTLITIPQLIKDAKQGFQQKLGRHYVYIDVLKKVPNNSVIIHPPQGADWPAIGNQPILRYFLYPRKLVSGALIRNNDSLELIDNAYFVFIPEDGHAPNWPIFNIENKKVIFNGKDYVYYSRLIKIAENPDLFYIEF